MVSTKKIDDDSNLSKAKKRGDHGRDEGTKNALNQCVVLAVWIGTIFGGIVVMILVGGIVWHWFKTDDYSAMAAILKIVGTGGVGYLIAYFRQSGINLKG